LVRAGNTSRSDVRTFFRLTRDQHGASGAMGVPICCSAF
jgi:hypothetical protein